MIALKPTVTAKLAMAGKLKTRNVFVDTEYFDASNMNFNSTALKELAQLAKKGRAQLFVTSVTAREVEAHISARAKEAVSAVKSFRDKARLLRNLPKLPFHSIFSEFDFNEVEGQLREQFQSLLNETGATILDINRAEPEKVFRQYFEKLPPFGEGKKKDEFPDAFAQAALEAWCEEHGEQVYVVSGDPDWEEVCRQSKRLMHLKKLEEFIALATEDAQEELAARAHAVYEKELPKVEEAVRRAFEWSGFYLEDESGDVSEVSVTEVELGDPLLLDVDQTAATFNVPVHVRFSADVSYDDYGAGSYDHEDKEWIYLPTKEETVEEEADFEAEVVLQYDVKGAREVKVHCTIERDFGVTVQPTDYELK